MKAHHPFFQSIVISVYMLDVECPYHPLTLTIAHYLMSHARTLLKLAYTPAPSLHNTESGDTNGFNTAMTVSASIFSNLMGRHRAQEVVTPEERGVFADPQRRAAWRTVSPSMGACA